MILTEGQARADEPPAHSGHGSPSVSALDLSPGLRTWPERLRIRRSAGGGLPPACISRVLKGEMAQFRWHPVDAPVHAAVQDERSSDPLGYTEARAMSRPSKRPAYQPSMASASVSFSTMTGMSPDPGDR